MKKILSFLLGMINLSHELLQWSYSMPSSRFGVLMQSGDDGTLVLLLKVKRAYKWTGSMVQLVELLYALDEVKCINNSEVSISELSALFGTLFNIDLRECYEMYTDMKNRKDDSRTYFLDKMQKKLNQRMECDDEKERKWRQELRTRA